MKKNKYTYSFNIISNVILISLIPIGITSGISMYTIYKYILSIPNYDVSSMYNDINTMVNTHLSIFIVSSIITFCISFFVAKHLVKPIIKFTNIISQMNNSFLINDDHIIKIEEDGPFEIQNLALTINQLIDKIYNYKKASEYFEKISNIDTLTNLNNKGYLLKKLSELYSIENHNISIIFLDIDKFKNINDTYGHSIGDKVLIEISKIITTTIDNSDFSKNSTIARYGGEEIVVLLENTNKENAYKLGEQLRVNVYNSIELHTIIKDYPISISLGISNSFMDSNDIQILLEQADKALYYSKQNGRNKCTMYNPSIQ